MEKDDVDSDSADVVVVVVVMMMPPLMTTMIAVDHDALGIVVVVVVAVVVVIDAVVELQSWHDVMIIQSPWIHCCYYYCCCCCMHVVVVPEGRVLLLQQWTQNLLSRTTTHPVCHIECVSHMRRPIVLPKTSYTLGGVWCSESFPSTNSRPNRIPERPQHMVWYSFLKGHGFHGTNISPGM